MGSLGTSVQITAKKNTAEEKPSRTTGERHLQNPAVLARNVDVEWMPALFRIDRLFSAHQIADSHLPLDLAKRRKIDSGALIFISVINYYKKIMPAPAKKRRFDIPGH